MTAALGLSTAHLTGVTRQTKLKAKNHKEKKRLIGPDGSELIIHEIQPFLPHNHDTKLSELRHNHHLSRVPPQGLSPFREKVKDDRESPYCLSRQETKFSVNQSPPAKPGAVQVDIKLNLGKIEHDF